MKISFWHIISTASIFLTFSCTKDPAYSKKTDDKDNVVIYLKQATTPSIELQLFPFIDEARTISLNAGFGAIGYPASDVRIQLSVDLQALDSLNQLRISSGLSPYETFPQDGYELAAEELFIKSGTLTSNSTEFRYFSKKFDPVKDYMMALSISDAGGYNINPKAKTVFLIVSKLAGKPSNTTGWEATASTEQTQFETTGLVSALFDNDVNTYWHSSWSPDEPIYPHWVEVDMKQLNVIDKIGLVPRQNNSNGFSKFNLEGSEDGINWTVLLTDAVFDPENKAEQTYTLSPASWRFLKLTMTTGRTPENKSTHLAELIVYSF